MDIEPQPFIPDDPKADLAGLQACIYITKQAPKYSSVVFDGYIINKDGSSAIKNGYISEKHIKFSTLATDGRKFDYEGPFSISDSMYIGTASSKID